MNVDASEELGWTKAFTSGLWMARAILLRMTNQREDAARKATRRVTVKGVCFLYEQPWYHRRGYLMGGVMDTGSSPQRGDSPWPQRIAK